MTEQQREDELLSELLDLQDDTRETQIIYGSQQPILTQDQELALLRAANAVGTPTLAPDDLQPAHDAPGSFIGDLAGVVRKHPMLAAVAVGGLVFALARRRRR